MRFFTSEQSRAAYRKVSVGRRDHGLRSARRPGAPVVP
jgi:hypothetical protein